MLHHHNITERQQCDVWDPVLRSFHWLLVITFFLSWWSEGQNIRIHILSGMMMVGLLLFRLIWGVIGDRHALFSNFYPSISSIRQHGYELLHMKSGRYIGHTPIGSVMIFILLVCLMVLASSGMVLMGLQMGIGLFAKLTTTTDVELLVQDVHAWCFTLLQWLVAVHLAGVLLESLLQRNNLVMVMITGKKTIKEQHP